MKRWISLLLCLLMIAGMALMVQATDADMDVGQTWDMNIFAGGIFDMFAWVGGDTDDYTYQWQADAAFGKGSWIDLEDNANPYGYAGTKTYHMQLITNFGSSNVLGSGWENIPFRCVITDKKTGATRTTADIFMQIFESDDLQEYLKKQGFGLYEPTVSGATGLKTTDDINYTASAPAGTALKIIGGCWRPSSEHLLRRSDMTENVEIWITENGKTVKTDNLATYTPYTIGKDAVTIQFKLHYTMGIHDMGYYETKTVKLTTKEPEPVAYGTTKYQISLLKERYNESEKLVSIPKDATVNVTEKSSGWYQVSWRGYVGYVASSTVTLQENAPIIDHVDIRITEPLAGQIPVFSCTATPETCFVTYMEWYDKTDKRELSASDRFQKGHDYQLVIWASAQPGYRFKLDENENMRTTAMINGDLPAFTSCAYEQIKGNVIDIRYDFINVKETDDRHTCSPKLVDAVPPTCTTDGHLSYYKCSCGKKFSDVTGINQIDPSTWGLLPAIGHTLSDWKTTQTEHYKTCSTCGETLQKAAHSGGNGSCDEKQTCTACGVSYGGNGEHLWSPTFLYQNAQGHAWICAACKAISPIQPHTPGPEATNTEAQICQDCGYIITPAKNHNHKPRQIPELKATCTQEGNREYYICDGCSDWFSDSTGQKVIDRAAVVLPATGHNADPIWHSNETIHWHDCSVCYARITATVGNHTDSLPCTVCGYGQMEQTEPTEPAQTPTPPAEDPIQPAPTPRKLPGWLLPLVIGVVCFGVAVGAAVLVLKRKGEK